MPYNPPADEVVHEYPRIGKLRARVLRKNGRTSFDLREYVESEAFEGFTRRGVRMQKPDVSALVEMLRDALSRGWLDDAS